MKAKFVGLTIASVFTGTSLTYAVISQNINWTANHSELLGDFEKYSYGKYDFIRNQTSQDFHIYVAGEKYDFSEKYGLYKNLLSDIDENESELVEQLLKDENTQYFNEFISYIFEKDEKIVCDNFIGVILNSRINLFQKSYKNALEICKKSRYKSLSKKANSILNYYRYDFMKVS